MPKPKKLPQVGEVWSFTHPDGGITVMFIAALSETHASVYIPGIVETLNFSLFKEGIPTTDIPRNVFEFSTFCPNHPHLAWRKSKGLA